MIDTDKMRALGAGTCYREADVYECPRCAIDALRDEVERLREKLDRSDKRYVKEATWSQEEFERADAAEARAERLEAALHRSSDLYEAASAEPCLCGDPQREPDCPACNTAGEARRVVENALADKPADTNHAIPISGAQGLQLEGKVMNKHDEALRALDVLMSSSPPEEVRDYHELALRRYINEQREAEQTIAELAGALRQAHGWIKRVLTEDLTGAGLMTRDVLTNALARLEQKEQSDA